MKAKKNVKIGDTKLVDNSIIEIIAKEKSATASEKKFVLTFSIVDGVSFEIGGFSLSACFSVLLYRFEAKSGLSHNQHNLLFTEKTMTGRSAIKMSSFGVTTASQIQLKLKLEEGSKNRPVFVSFKEFKKIIRGKTPRHCSTPPHKKTIVYIVVEKSKLAGSNIPSDLFEAVFYIGTSLTLKDLLKCFERHIRDKGYTKETHGLLILFEFDELNCEPFKNPNVAAEGYELKVASFQDAFQEKFIDKAGTTSQEHNRDLMQLFEENEAVNDKCEERIYLKLVEVLSNPEFIQE